MAKPANWGKIMLAAAERAQEVRRSFVPSEDGRELSPAQERELEREARAIEALSYRMAGLSYDQIAERLNTTADLAETYVERMLGRAATQAAHSMRALENARLDRLQAAVWPAALKGELGAVDRVIAISARRSRMNGMDAPKAISISANVRVEMQQALEDLRSVVMGEVVHEALDESDDDRDD